MLLLAALGSSRALALGLTEPADPRALDARQSRIFRAWMVRIVEQQLRQGPTPRWVHRDCAGLVRFAVAESFRRHDAQWRHANGISGALPPDLELTPEQMGLPGRWRDSNGQQGAYVSALPLIQENSRYVGRDANVAMPGDLLFFDQGDEQHLMVWLDGAVGYHTGMASGSDDGLRRLPIHELMRWKDTRWRPLGDNPNFIGFFRLFFLAS